MPTLRQTGENLFSNFLQAGQGVVTDLARESVARFKAALPADLIAERQRIDSINGSGAPSTAEALKVTNDQTAFTFGDPLNRATNGKASNPVLWIVLAVAALFAFGFFRK